MISIKKYTEKVLEMRTYSFKEFINIKKNLSKTFDVQILSGSMEPWIATNETITVKKCSPEELRPFDIIVYWKNDIFICHIFISLDENIIQTKPLTQNKSDPPFDKSFLLGKVISPKFRWYHKLLLKIFYK